MGFINAYPYTDFEQLNLDWLLMKMKELIDANNVNYQELQDLAHRVDGFEAFYDDIMAGDFPEPFKVAFDKYISENALDILGEAVKMVFFGLTDDGYFIAYIPESWDEITFGTTGLDDFPAGVDFGHLTLSY